MLCYASSCVCDCATENAIQFFWLDIFDFVSFVHFKIGCSLVVWNDYDGNCCWHSIVVFTLSVSTTVDCRVMMIMTGPSAFGLCICVCPSDEFIGHDGWRFSNIICNMYKNGLRQKDHQPRSKHSYALLNGENGRPPFRFKRKDKIWLFSKISSLNQTIWRT